MDTSTVDECFGAVSNHAIDHVARFPDASFGFVVPPPYVVTLEELGLMRKCKGVLDVTVEAVDEGVRIRIHPAVDTELTAANGAIRDTQVGLRHLTQVPCTPHGKMVDASSKAICEVVPVARLKRLHFKVVRSEVKLLCVLADGARVSLSDLTQISLTLRGYHAVLSLCVFEKSLALLLGFPKSRKRGLNAEEEGKRQRV